jgi:hypothetical protein
MKYLSASTKVADPYHAGMELGESLAGVAPDVVLVFCTIHYIDSIPDLVSGLKDVLGGNVLICGGTGDGIYETGGVANHGACALAIHTGGQSQWKAVLVKGVKSDSAKAAAEACRRVQAELNAQITVAFALADGLKADGARLVEGLSQMLSAPCFGGLAADDRNFARSIVFVNNDASEDAVMVLAASGRVPVRINAASGWRPVGDVGHVTRTQGAVLYEIDGRPAEVFLREQTGKTMGGMELAVLPLAEYTSNDDSQFVLRSCSHIEENGPVTLFGRIAEGARVRVCHAALEEILGGVETALSGVKDDGFEPGAAVIISCAGRKWLLARSGQEEVDRVIKELGTLPVIGIPSYGEISPFRSKEGVYSSAMFHNVTFVVGVLGI